MEKTIDLKVSEQELKIIMASLQEIPYKLSAVILEKLHKQYLEQKDK